MIDEKDTDHPGPKRVCFLLDMCRLHTSSRAVNDRCANYLYFVCICTLKSESLKFTISHNDIPRLTVVRLAFRSAWWKDSSGSGVVH